MGIKDVEVLLLCLLLLQVKEREATGGGVTGAARTWHVA